MASLELASWESFRITSDRTSHSWRRSAWIFSSNLDRLLLLEDFNLAARFSRLVSMALALASLARMASVVTESAWDSEPGVCMWVWGLFWEPDAGGERIVRRAIFVPWFSLSLSLSLSLCLICSR